jgi:hypothetical protein
VRHRHTLRAATTVRYCPDTAAAAAAAAATIAVAVKVMLAHFMCKHQ